MDLICPGCRRFDTSTGVSDARVNSAGQCVRCGIQYPVVDGVMCLAPDVPTFLEAQSWALTSDWLGSVGDDLSANMCDLDSYERFERALTAMYAEAHYPVNFKVAGGQKVLFSQLLNQNEDTLWKLVGQILNHTSQSNCVRFLDVGCGPGGLVSRVASIAKTWQCVGFDLRVAALRVAARLNTGGRFTLSCRVEGNRFVDAVVEPPRHRASSVTWVQGDLFNPPFRGESFDVIAAMSFLDTFPNPWFGLGQLDALLRPGGLLVLATPYHWEPTVVPEERWFCKTGVSSEQVVRSALGGESSDMLDLNYEIVSQSELPWALPAGHRLVHVYGLDVVVARKR
ncbi:MAG: methyltransferase domain-containing protein [Myxococcales bacterium]|nr:methyltransferase domain-containing protein [Myxococcales bacterium]